MENINGSIQMDDSQLREVDKLNLFPTSESARDDEMDNEAGNITKIDYFYFYEKEQLTTLWILFFSIVLGNCSVLVALFYGKGRGSRFRFFIRHLAVADLSVGLVSVLTDIVWKFTVEWRAGNAACKIVKFSQVAVTYSSTYVLVALTIDRYDAIRHPMNFSKSRKRGKALVAAAWLLSFLFSSPMVVLYEEKSIEGHLQCWIDLLETWHWQIYMVLISITVFFIPACIIATCYSIIIYTIWSKTNVLSKNRMNHFSFCTTVRWFASGAAPVTPTGMATNHSTPRFRRRFPLQIPGEPSRPPSRQTSAGGRFSQASGHRPNTSLCTQSLNPTEMSSSQTEDSECRRIGSRGLIPRAKIKTIKMTLIIVFVFVVCWSPYMLFDLLQVFGYVERTQSNIALATFIQSLAPLNSAANPIIYCLFSSYVCRVPRRFRRMGKCCGGYPFGAARKISCTATFNQVARASAKGCLEPSARAKFENSRTQSLRSSVKELEESQMFP